MSEQGTIKSLKIQVSASNVKSTNNSLKSLAASLQQIADIQKSMQTKRGTKSPIATIASSIQSLKGTRWSEISNGLGKIAQGLQSLKGTRWTDISKGIDKVAGSLERLNSISVNPQLADALARQMSAIAQIKTVSAIMQNAKASAQTAAKETGVTKSEGGIASQSLGSNMMKFVDSLDEVKKRYGIISGASMLLQGIGRGMSAVAHVAPELAKTVSNAAVSFGVMFTKMSVAPFKRVISSVKGATKSLLGFFSSAKRIVVYRAIRFALKEISAGFREGIANLYQYSIIVDGKFKQSMDTLATSALYVKNSLGAMVAPIVNSLAPAVDMLADKFVDLLNTINQLFATLTGASTWTRALKYPKEYAEAADAANGRAKELRATLLGFDEINRLDDNSRGSRGSAGEELDYSKMFTEEVVNTNVNSFVAKLKESFQKADFSDIGEILGTKLRDGLANINWDKIKSNVYNSKKSAATFINGIVNTDGLATELGNTIGEAFNTLVTGRFAFISNLDFEGIGTFIAETINKGIDTIDFKMISRTMCATIVGALKGINAFLTDTDFRAAGESIGEFIDGIDWEGALEGFGDALVSAIKAAFDAAIGLLKESPLGGSAALILLGLKLGSKLGAGIKAGIPTSITIAVTASVGFLVGNYLYQSFSDMFDDLAEGWNRLWSTDAYHAIANFWAMENGFADAYYYKLEAAEKRFQYLKKNGFEDETIYRANLARDQLEFFAEMEKQEREQYGEASVVADMWAKKQKELWASLPKDVEAALIKIRSVEHPLNLTVDINDLGQKVKNGLSSLKSSFKEFGNELGTAFKNAFVSSTSNATALLKKELNGTVAVSGGKVNKDLTYKVSVYGGGGLPEAGELFIAGERGVELVSSSGGRTQVSNRDQISASVATGNQEQNEYLRENNELLRELLAKEWTSVAEVTTDSLASGQARSNLREGRMRFAVQG